MARDRRFIARRAAGLAGSFLAGVGGSDEIVAAMHAEVPAVAEPSIFVARSYGPIADRNQSDLPAQHSVVLDVLDRIGCGAAIVNDKGCVIAANRALLDILKLEPTVDEGEPATFSDELVMGVRSAALRLRDGDRTWNPWEPEPGHSVTVMRLAARPGDTSSVIVLVDPTHPMRPARSTLRRLFGLTAAEIKIAEEIAAGHTPAEMAHKLHLTTPTIRSQLGSIFNKTSTRRQSQLVQLLARLSIIR